jgi:hypothetical protein
MEIPMSISNLVANAVAAHTNPVTPVAPVTPATQTTTPIITKKEAPMTTQTKKMNLQAKANLIAAQIYRKGMSPVDATAVGVAFMVLEDSLLAGDESWADQMVDTVYGSTVSIMAGKVAASTMTDFEPINWEEALLSSDLIAEVGGEYVAGKFLLSLNEEQEKAFARPASEAITSKNRKKKIMKNGAKLSRLSRKTFDFLQTNQRTISTEVFMLQDAVYNGWGRCDEQYVVEGAFQQIEAGNVPSIHEYFGCSRVRTYQGSAHSGNVQASDMARALLSPYGVTMDYDHDAALDVLKSEAADMINLEGHTGVDMAIKSMDKYSDVEFMRLALTKGSNVNRIVKKPWSFYKISRLILALEKGNKPYLDITVGLDAKCSGPQIGSLMVGDKLMAAMCGMTEEKGMDDAYMNCAKHLEEKGFVGFDRDAVKKPFMGVFYGQGWMAFADLSNYAKEGKEPTGKQHEAGLLQLIASYSDDMEVAAKAFHKVVEASFGAKLVGLRKLIHNLHFHYEGAGEEAVRVDHCEKPTNYFLPDGQNIATQYFMKQDINGVVVGHKAETVDVKVDCEFMSFRFNQLAFKTEEYDMGSYAHTGFVNLIQSVDGLVARLIISKLQDLGATHVDAVHDCFRVSVPDFISGMLHNAIEFAYDSLFGCKTDRKTLELPYGTDILKMYVEGVNRACKPEFKMSDKVITKMCSQFQYSPRTKESTRNLYKVGMDVNALVHSLQNDLEGKEGTYYFAK